jgi:ribosomal-protein-alanine N-acetyltransferase
MKHQGTRILETERLVLRRFCATDAQAMFDNWANDPEVTRFLTWQPHQGIDVTRSVLSDWIRAYERSSFYQWAICPRKTGEPIGSISVVNYQENVSAFEIGYCIGKRWWRQGITSEALQAVIDYLFAEVGALRVCADHDSRNPNSGRVMRHCGMTYEGTLRQACHSNAGVGDMCVHAILRNEWDAGMGGPV